MNYWKKYKVEVLLNGKWCLVPKAYNLATFKSRKVLCDMLTGPKSYTVRIVNQATLEVILRAGPEV